MEPNKFCQSCGMPLKGDVEGGGTNKDGTKSTKYCSYCYKDGTFVNSDIKTAKEMQTFCIQKMKEQGVAHWKAWLFTRCIPKLERWKKEVAKKE